MTVICNSQGGRKLKFKKQDESWPFAHSDEVDIEVMPDRCVVVDGKYAMTGWTAMKMQLPDVPIIEGKSVATYRKKVLGL